MTLIDLSHTIHDGLETYPGIPAPQIADHMTFDESAAFYAEGTEFQIASISMAANTGTYLDTPSHRFRTGTDLEDVALDRVADVPGFLIDAGGRGRAVGSELMPLGDLTGSAVLIRTDWSRHFGTAEYVTDAPYLTVELTEALVGAGVSVVGIDSLNIDCTDTNERPVHTALLAAGMYPVEHMANLESLAPETPFRFFAVPPKIRGMGTFTVRAFAIQ